MEEWAAQALEMEDKDGLIDEIMIRYGQEILQLVYSYVRNKETAEDLTQDIFVKCYKSLHTYSGKSKLRTWLWRIAINQCKDFLKSWHHKNVETAGDKLEWSSSANESIEQMVIQKEEDTQLVSVIMMMPVKYREVIYLYYYENLPIKEIALVIGVSENTVKTRLRRAKVLLKERLEEI